MHGLSITTDRFGPVQIHVLPADDADAEIARMVDRAVRDREIIWHYGMTPGPEWDLFDDLGRRYRPVALRGRTLYVRPPEAHRLRQVKRESRPMMSGERKKRKTRVYREEEG